VTPEQRKVEALLAMGRSSEAVALVQSIHARGEPDVEFLRLRGRVLRAAGRVFDAEESFRSALALTPRDPRLLADLATTLVGQRRPKDALPYAREAVSLKPQVAAYQALLGFIAESLDLTDEAHRALKLARELAPTDAETHTVYGYHLLRLVDLEGAERAFIDALMADPRKAEAARGLARVALARGDWETARSRWLEALALDPTQHDARLHPMLTFGHPALRPVRRAARLPLRASISAAVAGALALAAVPAVPPVQILSITLFAVAAAGPIARRALAGGLGE